MQPKEKESISQQPLLYVWRGKFVCLPDASNVALSQKRETRKADGSAGGGIIWGMKNLWGFKRRVASDAMTMGDDVFPFSRGR